jgi:hypothetical protein
MTNDVLVVIVVIGMGYVGSPCTALHADYARFTSVGKAQDEPCILTKAPMESRR